MNGQQMVLKLNDISSKKPGNIAAIFSLSNGYVGIQASNPINGSNDTGTLVNGFFEYSPITYGEAAAFYPKNNQTIVPVLNLRKIILLDENHHRFDTATIKDISLNLENGQLHEVYEVSNQAHKKIEMTVVSAIDQKNLSFYGIKFSFKPLSYKGKLIVDKRFKLDAISEAADIGAQEDPRKTRRVNSAAKQIIASADDREILKIATKKSNQSITIQGRSISKKLLTERDLTTSFDLTYIYQVSKGDENKVVPIEQHSFVKIKENSHQFWEKVWQQSAVMISGNDEINLALHFNIFQLNQAAGRDGHTNIAAKGLTGPGYEGHTFWDTEMYMMPYFIYTNPEIAKSLLIYRYHTLAFARKRARELGVDSGALFAWRSINGEETSAYYPASTAAYHLNGDIAYAIGKYYETTDDDEFMEKYGFEILLETARFWREFGSWTEKNGQKKFEFLTVTGPDEYTAMVDNNYFTNRMAENNLQLAYTVGHKLAVSNPKILLKLNTSENELRQFQHLSTNIYFPRNTQYAINAQDDSFFSKPIWPFQTTPNSQYPLLLHYHPLHIYRYQVNKQADTILADFLFPETITESQLGREFDYYEKITTHDSSLSRSIFSAVAARMGNVKKAYSYFSDTVRMDLIDLQGNTEDGLHLANLGGSWLDVVQGFAGMQVTAQGILKILPHLPEEWNSFEFRLMFKKRLLKFVIDQQITEITLINGDPLEVIINQKKYTLSKIIKINN
ncbi:glycoside hydrolase family 65 protein [Fructobacillus americanaquae]|uniref:Glycoside hydrolase family 65 protein n=1 Tax=Fructobacillus americanaquae TaxID=2940302 RepID=A0ABY5BY64_9LACO|nr:glycosyl hydrolase family 65 protein [Fructobacillus americanaquae]USS91447.1 glycoside hydrolase family 65 protein [Fructobacillus americanaquae]